MGPGDFADDFAFDENERMRRLKAVVDLTADLLSVEVLSVDQAKDLLGATKHMALHLFPGKEETYDMIYGKRFARIMRDRFAAGASIDQTSHDEEAETRS